MSDPKTPGAVAPADEAPPDDAATQPRGKGPLQKPGEIGGRDGPEPTRFGDWEVNGRCTDF